MNYPAMAEDVREFVADHRFGRISLLGHSMGGKVAMQLAVRHPDEIEKLIVVDMAPKSYPPAHKPLLHAMRSVDLAGHKSFGDISTALAAGIPDPVVRQFIVKNVERDIRGDFHWRLGLDEIIENYDELTKPLAGERPFTKPSCFIRGGRSDFIQDSDLAGIRELFPGAELRTISQAGHWVHIDATDEFYTVVTGFLGAPAG
jgi:esterase